MGLHTSRAACRGFTLIELLIAVVVVGVIGAIAFPSFQSQVRKSRRTEAVTALSQLQQAEERHRSGQPAYSDNVTAAPTASPPGLGLAATTPSSYYDIAIASASGTGYIATATARSGTSQASDTGCTLLVVRMDRGELTYGSASTTTPLTDTSKCWAR